MTLRARATQLRACHAAYDRRTALAALAAGLLLAGCGGGAATSSQHSATSSAQPSATSTTTNTGTQSSRTTAAQQVRASIVGDDHAPKMNKAWHYTVTVTGPNGEKLSGTETTHYTYNGIVVGTEKPQNVKFTGGVYHDTIEFPAAAVGHPLAVQAVVKTRMGSATASWPVQVTR